MNDRDSQNMQFILSLTPEKLAEWWNTISDDDQDYALNLVKQYRQELELMAIYDNPNVDTTQAKNYLKKFQL